MESELPLPLPEVLDPSGPPDLRILSGGFEAPEPGFGLPHDAGGATYGPYRGGILLRALGGPDFLLTESSIRVSDGASPEASGDLALRVALGLVLQLRGILAFHGAAAAREGKAIAILGARGSGKSTTALGLAREGWSLLCDDIVVIQSGGLVPRGSSRARLNEDSYERLVPGARGDLAPRDGDGKIPVDAGAGAEAARLRWVLVLRADEVDRVELREARGYEKLRATLPHLHSPRGIGAPGSRLLRAAEALEGASLFVATRPAGRFALEELLGKIAAMAEKESP